MADIAMTYTAVENLANSIDDMRRQLEDMRSALDTLVSSTEGSWKGSAHKKFVSSYQKLEPKMHDIGNLLEEYSRRIRSAMKSQQDTDANSAAGLSSTAIVSF